jgi:hypothetical protein
VDTHGVVPADGRVRYRPSIGQQVSFFVVIVLLLAGGLFASSTGHFWIPLPGAALLAAEYLYLGRSVGITLTPDEAIVHTFRRRRIQWRDVQHIQIEKSMGSRVIVIYEESTRRTQLRAPISGFLYRDKRFEEKFHTIGQWWLAHQGADWTSDGAPSGRERGRWDPNVLWARRSRIRPAFTQVGPILLTLASLSLEIVIGVFAMPAGGQSAALAVIAVPALAAILTAVWHFGLHAGVTLTTEALKAHNPRPRTIPWAEIESISAERTWHGTRLAVHEASGRRTRLSSPRIGLLLWDHDFGAKAQAIHARWRTALGADSAQALGGEPDSVAAAALDLTAVRKPMLWKRLLVVLVCIGLTYELLIGMLVTALLVAFG